MENAAEALITMKEARTRLNEVRRDRGYNRPAGDSTSKPNAKKTSGKHACFDCKQHGHWAGDHECTKPGQGLGRKASPKKVPKQVKMAETLVTETIEEVIPENGVNEVLVATCRTLSEPLVDALMESHAKTKRSMRSVLWIVLAIERARGQSGLPASWKGCKLLHNMFVPSCAVRPKGRPSSSAMEAHRCRWNGGGFLLSLVGS